MKALLAAFSLGFGAVALAADVQVIVQQVEMSHQQMSAVIAQGLPDHELFNKVRGMVAAKSAKLHDTNLIRLKAGERGAIESIRELIYLTEYDPDSSRWVNPKEREKPGITLSPEEQQKIFARAVLASAFFPVLAAMNGKPNFETRHVGASLVVDSDPAHGVRWSLEQVDYVRDTIMGRTLGLDGKPRIQRMLAFDSLRLNGNSSAANAVSFAGALTPVEADGSLARDRKILVFVKADTLEEK